MGVRGIRLFSASLLAGAGLLASCVTAAAEPMLPDLIVWADQAKHYLYGGQTNPSLVPGETVYQFTGALPNIGPGRLEVREVTHADATQDVFQRIYDENDQFDHERLIGSFPGADSIAPRHLWLPGIAQYNIRTVLDGGGVGEIVASHDKTSMAVVDGGAYDTSILGAPSSPHYNSLSAELLGISVGWGDIYGSALPGQWVQVTGLANGQYWLEVVVDPYDQIEEADETNNVARILVDLVIPEPTILSGDYNRDNVVDAADYTVWRDTLGFVDLGDQGAGADGDGSGTIRQADYDIWKSKFGAASGAGSVSVPEPVNMSYVAMALVTARLISNRGRRRSVGIQLGA
jgi:Lysyl oxidase